MPHDTLNRRLRFAPPLARAARLMITDADHLVFEAIDRHGPLPSNYLYEFTKHLRRDRTHLQNRLTEFYNGDAHGTYLIRPRQQFAAYEARYQHLVYDLAPRARMLLAERSTLANRRARPDPFVHQLMLACVGASIERAAPTLGLRYISLGEVLAHPRCGPARTAFDPLALPIAAASATLIPDGLFGLEYPGKGFRFFAVEIDRNTQSIERKNLGQSAFGQKVTGYLAALRTHAYRAWWGIPNLHVLTVTTSATHSRNLIAYIGKRAGQEFAQRFGVAVTPDFGANWRVPRELLTHLLTEPWIAPHGQKSIAAPVSL